MEGFANRRDFLSLAFASAALVTFPARAERSGARITSYNRGFDRLLDPNVEVSVIAAGGGLGTVPPGQPDFGASLESPLWWPAGGCLLFSDIPQNRIMAWHPKDGLSVFVHPTGHANGLWIDQQGRLLMAEHSGRQVARIEADGSRTVIMRSYRNQRLNRPNCVTVRSDGGIYFTDYAFRPGPTEDWDVDFEGIYYVSPDLRIKKLLARDIEAPHKIIFSIDERTLFVGQYQGIIAFDVADLQSTEPGASVPGGRLIQDSRRWFWKARDDESFPGEIRRIVRTNSRFIDGIKIDLDGNLWCSGRDGVWVISSTGQLLGHIDFGESTPNLAFGGEDRRTLFITANKSVYSLRTRIAGVPIPRPTAS